ncbi:hypothetical protein VF21_09126 [Pseudogymnoascus sp. 05NY08]|nr:hypothetical protein VF21_09126 [Pseudogymnoascus sp. 05NY08]
MVHIVKDIHAQLTEWENSLPPELKLDSWNKQAMEKIQDSTSHIFAMQALTLQISYDNIQLLLHRPLMTYQGSSTQLDLDSRKLPVDAPHSSPDVALNLDIIELGRSQCWKSALRTSGVDSYAPILRLVGNTPAATNVGIHCLTSGVMLGVLALSDPAGPRVQDCKRGIASLIKVPRNFGLKSVVWDQNAEILTDLMHVIAAEEVKAMLSQDGNCCESDITNTNEQPLHGIGQTATEVPVNRQTGWERTSNSQSTMDIGYERVPRSPSLPSVSEDTQTPSQPPVPLPTTYASYGSDAFTSQFDFSRDSRVDMDFDIDLSTIPMHQHGLEYNGEAQFGVRSLEQPPSMRNIGVSADTFPSLDHPEQLWIWGPPFAFP